MCSGIGRQPLEVVGLVPERHASIAFAVLMPADETIAFVAEHQRAGGHESATAGAAVLEAACQHDRNRIVRVALFEGAILRARCADDVRYGPAVAAGDDARRGAAGRSVFLPSCERIL